MGTIINIGTSPAVPAERYGINLSYPNFYDSGQMMKMLVFRNPGFEGEIYQSTVRCAGGTANTALDENIYAGWPDGFWDGASVEFVFGSAMGRKDVVARYTASDSGSKRQGIFQFENINVLPQSGDYFIVRKVSPGNPAAGWWVNKSGGSRVATGFNDLPPGSDSKQCISISAGTAADQVTLDAYFDTTPRNFVLLNGTFRLTFKAKGTGGSNSIAVSTFRGSMHYATQTIQLTNVWDIYTVTFSASETAPASGLAGISFSTVGADSFLLDDVSFMQVDGDPANKTVFRDAVVRALKELNPKTLRFWANQLGDTLDNLIAPVFGRQRSAYTAYPNSKEDNEPQDICYSLHEFLELCEAIGANPWFCVPSVFSTAEASNLIEYFAGDASTPYGARRSALGHPAPWTSSFSKIHLEFGNENWNSGSKGGGFEYPDAYGQRARAIFAAMRAHPAFVEHNLGFDSPFSLILGGQAGYAERNTSQQDNCNNNDFTAIAPYMMNTVTDFGSDERLFGSMLAEPEAFLSPNSQTEGKAVGQILLNQRAMIASKNPRPLAIYEINIGTDQGSITQDRLNQLVSSMGAGLAVVLSMLLNTRAGLLTQVFFALPQYSMSTPVGNALMWGAVVDMGVTDRRRPQFLAMQLANQAIGDGAVMLPTTHTGDNPTWDQPLANTVALSGAHHLHSFAFAAGSRRSLIVFNVHRTDALSISLNNPIPGPFTCRQLKSSNITDRNEDKNLVTIVDIGSSTLPLWLPPFSMTVLMWDSGTPLPTPTPIPTPTPAPTPVPPPPPTPPAAVISGVATNAMVGQHVTWKTDEPATSAVAFGPNSQYGSMSSADPKLITDHAITLANLTPGFTYHFSALSANAQGVVTTSPDATFVAAAGPITPPPAPTPTPIPTPTPTPGTGPTISALFAWPITKNGALIGWTTNVPTTGKVDYGPTLAYGSVMTQDPSAPPSPWPRFQLTGLQPNTTYHFRATSFNAAGAPTVSEDRTFTTTNF